MSGILDGLKRGLDSILGLRDSLGLAVAEVFFVERRWSGKKPGDGTYVDERRQMIPSPLIVDYAQDIRLLEAGSLRRGDLILKHISKNRYGREELSLESSESNLQLFYEIRGELFRAVYIKEDHMTWAVHIRPVTGE